MATGSEWIKAHPERLPVYYARRRVRHAEMRRQVLALLGGVCVCCSLGDSRFLSVDHIHNDGNVERRTGVRGTWMGYHKVLHDPDPKRRYQILCFNCNMAKARNGGRCPHPESVIAYGWCVGA